MYRDFNRSNRPWKVWKTRMECTSALSLGDTTQRNEQHYLFDRLVLGNDPSGLRSNCNVSFRASGLSEPSLFCGFARSPNSPL